MKIDIFDVGHGACSVVTCSDGRKLMIDCGAKKDPPYWWPSIQFYGETFAGLILTNLDEDHVSNFESTIKNIRFASICINDTINAAALRLLKRDGMGSGIQAVYNYLQSPAYLNAPLEMPEICVSMFRFPYGTFDDTNNLSLVTFVQYGSFCIFFPGDMEDEALSRCLLNEQFRSLLAHVNLFVTPHHGRENGCCPDLFENGLCTPDAFIVSDKEMAHETQETTAWYRQHARGLHKIPETPWTTPEVRYVFTTRTDECISIDVPADGRFILYPKSGVQQNVEPKRSPVPALDWSSLLMASLGGNSSGSRK